MKITKSLNIAAIIVVCMVLALAGCKDKSTLLARTWKLENLRYTRDIPADMRPAIDAQIEQLKQQFSLTYNSDGTYTSGMMGQEVKGTWKLNSNSTKITSTGTGGVTTDYNIMELTAERFTFKAMEGKEEVIFVMVPK